MRKKILYVITKSDVGGAQKYIADLGSNLDKNKFEPKILYGGKDIKWLSNKVWPWTFFLNDWLAIWELAKVYQKEKPDIIHLNSSKTGVLGSLAAWLYALTLRPTTYDLRPKVVFTAHGWVFNPTNYLSLLVRWFYILLHKFAALFQNKIICVSEYDYQLALRYGIAPRAKLITVHNGIDPNMKFLNKETARKEIITKLKTQSSKLKTDSPWIGSIGRLVKEKNYETLVKAATLVPNAYFFIIGSGPKSEELKVKSEKLKVNERLFFVEPGGEDYKYLKALDIFVMSSIKEGLPYILLEAMAAELPVVVTEAGGIPEIIKNHENGLMVAQKNPQQLASAIRGLLDNQSVATELKKTAKEAVREKFSLEKMISKTESVYLE
ncbi:MAG: glycosyltransferase family 4 protein [Candidatus Harrisonbacteria bacterium]|nr:glycosyltransferase family 4 protein [Candidatus Harrisonbacteria bacterium]